MSVGHVPVEAASCCLTHLFLLVNALVNRRKALRQSHAFQHPEAQTIKAEVARLTVQTGANGSATKCYQWANPVSQDLPV